MKSKIFSLVFGVLVILIVPALIAACCNSEKKKNKTEQTVPAAPVSYKLAYSDYEVIPSAYFVHKVTSGYSTPVYLVDDNTSSTTDTTLIDTSNPLWLIVSGIANLVLLLLSTLFGKFWTRARSVLNSIYDGVKDGSLSSEDIAKIVKAWKG